MFIEPSIHEDGQEKIIWVCMGAKVWRCAVEQLRPATATEVAWSELQVASPLALPMDEMMRKMKDYVDVTEEPKRRDEDMVDLPESPDAKKARTEAEPASASAASSSAQGFEKGIKYYCT